MALLVLGETIYQVGQDPVGTGEALWKMGSDAVDWASKGEKLDQYGK